MDTLLIIILYFIITVITTAVIMIKEDIYEMDEVMYTGILWPITIPIAIIWWAYSTSVKILVKILTKILK